MQGLRFPLHPVSIELLNAYNVTVSELYPNAWGYITFFLILYSLFDVKPSLTDFRYIFRAQVCPCAHGPGWITFQHRRGYRIVTGMPDSTKSFRYHFAFLYSAHGWDIKTTHDQQPNLTLNNQVPQCGYEESLIIYHTETEIVMGDYGPVFVQRKFIIDNKLLSNDLVLSAMGIGSRWPQCKLLNLRDFSFE